MAGCGDSNSNFLQFDMQQFAEQEPYILLVKHRADDYSTEVSNQLTQALDYAKIPFRTVDLGLISGDFDIPDRTRSIIITTYLSHELEAADIRSMVRFTARGNSVVFTSPVFYENMMFLQGINSESEYAIDSTGRGVHADEMVFPGFRGNTFFNPNLSLHTGFKKDVFNEDVQILASTASNRDIPLILSNKIGLGEVITFNSNAMNIKLYRGLLFSGILKGLSGLPYSVANVSTIFLDDFPAPLYNEKLPPVDEEYDITHSEFVSRVWWPDMKAFADSFNIDYSAMTAFNYNANVVPPFDFDEWKRGAIEVDNEMLNGSIYLAQDVKNSRHELAYHGYNHFSLVMEDWQNLSFMVSAVQAARKQWRIDNLGDFPSNYVPPTNYIDSVGIQALVRGMPSIDYMSSLYLGDEQDGAGREFGPDPYAPAELFNYPRITSGFTVRENSMFDQHSLQLLTGIWTHFIHPDDVFQVVQREDDEFSSRNPQGLGWKNTPGKNYGLYHLFRERVLMTNKQYPLSNYITATAGGKYTEDWRNRLSLYVSNEHSSFTLYSLYRPNYTPKSNTTNRHWFMYVEESKAGELNPFLNVQNVEWSRSRLWDGYLYQIHTEKEYLKLPVLKEGIYFDEPLLEETANAEIEEYINYLLPDSDTFTAEEWRDTRMEEALSAYKKNPQDRDIQNQLIDLSIEFGEVYRAINILEKRLLNNPAWDDSTSSSLIRYYGWEGAQNEAEMFLESLWMKYGTQRVIEFKNQAVSELGLYGEAFNRRWLERELKLNPGNDALYLNYARNIESQENWPEVKQILLNLIERNPKSDSLYAYTLQRSIYYAGPDSTIALLERFPRESYSQLEQFASDFAFMYAYDIGNLGRALYWAKRSDEFDRRVILEWMAELNLYTQFNELANQMLSKQPDNYELRNFIGSTLFYEGFSERGYQVLYPIFEADANSGLSSDTLLTNEISYMPYEQKKEFYLDYPAFFTAVQADSLQAEYRWNEGVRGVLDGEYRFDNFDNAYARGGLGVEFGNRRKLTHTISARDLYFSDRTDNNELDIQNFAGMGYAFQYRSDDQQFTLSGGPAFLIRQSDFLPELNLAASYSYDSTFTSGEISYQNVYTSRSISENIDRIQMQLYREDQLFSGRFVSALSGTGRYYTNDVLSYELFGRFYIQPNDKSFRIRPLAELSYSDASKSYLSGSPYYTPDQYFSTGAGIDARYRYPNNFDYDSRITGEVLAKYASEEGYFFTGRLQAEHKLNNFWQINLGTEISTSSVYRSNRFFISISHTFPLKLNPDNK